MLGTRNKFASTTSTITLSMLSFGYSRGAYAGDCTGAAGVFICDGPADPGTDTTQTITVTGGPLDVTTAPGSGIAKPAGAGLDLGVGPRGSPLVSMTPTGRRLLVTGRGSWPIIWAPAH